MIEIPRITDLHSNGGDPGWCSPIRNGKPTKPVLRCECGVICGLGFHHVKADGRVLASVHHKAEALGGECSELCVLNTREVRAGSAFLQLKDYDQGEFS